jgi:DNA-binding GntR family transcriptional regulator
MPLPENVPQVVRPSARELVYDKVRAWIEEGILAPGDEIREAELAQTLNVSRTPAREALHFLLQQGLVVQDTGKTVRVADMTIKSWRDVFEPLASLEAIAFERAAVRMTDSELDELQAIQSRFAQAARDGDKAAIRESDSAFHELIVVTSRNQVLVEPMRTLWVHWRRLETAYFPKAVDSSVSGHERLIAAIKDRDPREAKLAAVEAWERTGQEVGELLRRLPGDADPFEMLSVGHRTPSV